MKDNKKVAIVGTGFVGMSCAYSLLNQNACDDLLLIDINEKKAIGEVMDLNHSLAFSPSEMHIHAGKYSDCTDADIIVISAGVSQKPGESRIDLLKRNYQVFETIISPITASGFSGIFLIATNPVDIMTYISKELSGFDKSKVIGTGTSLDTARLRYLLGHYFKISPKNVHAYVIGEHGDSELIPWSQAMLATKPVLSVCKENNEFSEAELKKIGDEVKFAAQKIIEAKSATYYGIGMALVRIIKAILNDENSIITVSSLLDNCYGNHNIYAGVPTVIGRNGSGNIIELNLSEEENELFNDSCKFLADSVSTVL